MWICGNTFLPRWLCFGRPKTGECQILTHPLTRHPPRITVHLDTDLSTVHLLCCRFAHLLRTTESVKSPCALIVAVALHVWPRAPASTPMERGCAMAHRPRLPLQTSSDTDVPVSPYRLATTVFICVVTSLVRACILGSSVPPSLGLDGPLSTPHTVWLQTSTVSHCLPFSYRAQCMLLLRGRPRCCGTPQHCF